MLKPDAILKPLSPLTRLQALLDSGDQTPATIAAHSLAHANANQSRNTYLHLDAEALLQQAAAPPAGPLHGVPISLKDCIDLAGTITTCGSRAYSLRQQPSLEDASLAKAIRRAGGLITGKTHLHPLAYGITGQNADYGDCLQPRDPSLLTGGSSSGAAASVQEGSALAAIGTDTGGSIRVPAALCGLAGYRASHALAARHVPNLWTGAVHLAPSFDTPGLLVRDPRDLAPIAEALFGVARTTHTAARIGYVAESFLEDATSDVLACFHAWQQQVPPASTFDATWWSGSRQIFADIQAVEAARIHSGFFDEHGPVIAERLHRGASISAAELANLLDQLGAFRAAMASLFAGFDFLIVPCAPISRLFANEDQSHARNAILRYTTPFSLAGLPVISLPGEIIGAPFGTGIQVAAAAGEDSALLAFAATLGDSLAQPEPRGKVLPCF